MSLTSFVKDNDVKEFFKENLEMPEFTITGNILAHPRTANYGLVGTAFDYLLRFYIQHLNPKVKRREWIAEIALEGIVDCESEYYKTNEEAELALLAKEDYYKWAIIPGSKNNGWRLEKSIPMNESKYGIKCNKILESAKANHAEYLRTGRITDDILKDCICLAHLDAIYRIGWIDYKTIGKVDDQDILDLRKLYEIINPDIFFTKKVCILNPNFKNGHLVGGADLDLIIGDTIIDIKTTKYLEFKREYLNQLIGYYLLYLNGGINKFPSRMHISYLGIYFSRHALLFKFPIWEVIKPDNLDKVASWFLKKAKRE